MLRLNWEIPSLRISTNPNLTSMTRGSPSKTPVVHQINFHKLNEINRESALASGKKDWAPIHSVTVGGVDVDLQVRVPAPYLQSKICNPFTNIGPIPCHLVSILCCQE